MLPHSTQLSRCGTYPESQSSFSWKASARGSRAARPLQPRRETVERLDETRQRLERARVPLLLDVQAQHRLGTDEPDRQPIRILARRPVRIDERCAGDRMQLSRALMEEELDMGKRLEPRAEARLRLAHALRDRSYPSAVEGVEMEDAIGLAEPERAQDHRLRLVAPPHASQV